MKLVEVFESIIKDIKRIRNFRTKKFTQSRGIWLYEKLEEYSQQLDSEAKQIPEGYRM